MKNLLLVIAIGSLNIIWGCSKSAEEQKRANLKDATQYEGPAVKNDWHIYWLPANPTTLNPITQTDTYSSAVTGSIFDTLVYFDPMTGEPRARAATRWEISENGLIYDFYIREGMKFHDGQPVTIEDIKYSYDMIKDPSVDAAHLQNYFADLESVEIISPTQLRMKMKRPYFRNLIVLGLVEIIPKHIYGKGDFNTNPAGRAPVGSGPYKFHKWDQGRLLELHRFKDYWGTKDEFFKNKYNFEKLLFRVITEQNVAALSLKKGEIDSLEPSFKQYLEDFVGEDFEKNFYRLKYTTEDGDGFGFIGWNLKRPIFQSKNIRRALSMALPREEINQKIYNGMRTLAVSQFPSAGPKVSPNVKPILYQPDEALKLFETEGWKLNASKKLEKNGQIFQFDLLFTAQNEESQRIALIYQQSLRKIGVELNIKTLEWTVFIKNIREGNFDAAMLAWGSSLDNDPYQIWHSSQANVGGSNFIGFSNKRADELMEKARVTLDRAERNKLYQQLSEIVADEAPYLFLFERPSLYITSKRFANVLPIGKIGLNSSAFFTPPGFERYETTAQAN